MDTASDSPLAHLMKEVKEWKAHRVRVTTADGETRDIAVPGTPRRRQWGRLQHMFEALAWVRVEGLGKQGDLVLGICDNEDFEATDIEDLEGAPDRNTGQVAKLVAIVCRAQDHALKRFDGMLERQASAFGKVLEVQGQVLDTLAGRLVTTEEKYADVLDTMQTIISSEGDGIGSESGDAMDGFLKMVRGVKEVKELAEPMPKPRPKETKPNGET